jgi:hypothetical protein
MTSPALPGGSSTFPADPRIDGGHLATFSDARESGRRAAGRGLAFLAALLALTRVAAPASVIVAKDFAALVAEADLIFVGTVERVESRWTNPQRDAIETIVTFSELEPIRGPVGREVALRFGGGEVDGVREEIAGVPRFVAGERVVLFARQDHSLCPIVGFSQGCFRVIEDSEGNTVRGCDGRSIPLSREASELKVGTSASRAATRVSLDEFLDRIRREMGRESGEAD